jgi:hypothetical protein
MSRRTPLYIICSPRPRVGRTLMARMLMEFFHADLRPVAGFDLNPNDPALADFLPGWTAVANVSDMREQIGLFDRLITADGTPKVVDLGPEAFQPFFAVMQQIEFVPEARYRGIEPMVLFMVDPDRLSARSYAGLRQRFPDTIVIPVYNEVVTKGYDHPETFPPAGPAATPLRIPQLSPLLKGVINKPSFSFASYVKSPADTHTELHFWIKRVFREFRELELRMLLGTLRSSLQSEP